MLNYWLIPNNPYATLMFEWGVKSPNTSKSALNKLTQDLQKLVCKYSELYKSCDWKGRLVVRGGGAMGHPVYIIHQDRRSVKRLKVVISFSNPPEPCCFPFSLITFVWVMNNELLLRIRAMNCIAVLQVLQTKCFLLQSWMYTVLQPK